MEKRKQAVDLTDLALGLVILGIVVTIGANVLINLQANRLTDLTTVAVNNETVTASDSASTALSTAYFKSVTSVTNTTGGETVAAGNYSVTTNAGGYGEFLLTDAAYDGESLNVTYDTYDTTSRADYELAGNAATGLAEYGNWFSIIVIVGIAALILTLIFMAFGRRDGGAGSVAY